LCHPWPVISAQSQFDDASRVRYCLRQILQIDAFV
jgi:hypothetical protein